MSTYEIRLVIDRNEEDYIARWVDSSGQSSLPFRFLRPLDDFEMEDLQWYLEEYLQLPGEGDYRRAENIESQLVDWGHKLFESVFGNHEGHTVYHNLMGAMRLGQAGLITLGSNDPFILQQPWEMIRDRRGPLTMQGVTIRRQLEGAKLNLSKKFELPLRILLIVSRPRDLSFVDPESSVMLIRNAFENLYDYVEIDFCLPPTIMRLEELLSAARNSQKNYHIIHFDGHGIFKPISGKGALAFEDENRDVIYVTGTQLGDILAGLDVPLVILEACQGAHLSSKSVFGSLAPSLLESGVGSVIAFSYSAHIDAACLLVKHFYLELAIGGTIGKSLDQARRAMHANRLRLVNNITKESERIECEDWFVPQLYQVGDDVALFYDDDKKRKTSKVRITIELDINDYDSKTQRLLKYGLASFLETSPESIILSRADKGSVKVTVELPASSAEKLLEAFNDNRNELVKSLNLNVTKITQVFNPPPPPAYGFFGRAKETLELERLFNDNYAVVISGMGGVGKTALAREAAVTWLRSGHFEQVVFINFEQRSDAFFVVQMIGMAFEGDSFSRRSAEEREQDGQWQTSIRLFHERRALVVWDNFESTLSIFQSENGQAGNELTAYADKARSQLQALYRDLTVGKPNSRLLVTCRPQETGLPDIREYALEGLKRADSLRLLTAAIETRGIKADLEGYERYEMDKLLDLLADHPLSIELIAPHLRDLTPAEIRADFSALLDRLENPSAGEDRNKSLRASLEFSRRRLSKPSQEMLAWLAWFEGGVFERILLDFADIEPAAWEPIRIELEATALLKVETIEGFNTPYLRFHPTLSYASRPQDVPDSEAASERFIKFYLAIMGLAEKLLGGQQPAAGMALIEREEGNFHRALQAAFERGLRSEAQSLADILRLYLERAGRNRERDILTEWVRAHLPNDVLDVAAGNSIRNYAWTLVRQGNVQEALNIVQNLLARLQSDGLANGDNPASEIALSYRDLGRIFLVAHRPDLSLEPLQQALMRFEQISGIDERGYVATTLGNLASAYTDLGQFEEALNIAERGLRINRELRREREVAVNLGVIANILTATHHYAEAEARYAEAMQAAQATSDLELQGKILHQQALLQREQDNYPRAVDLFKQTLTIFQRANDLVEEMRTCDQLATAEAMRGELDAAEAWYKRAQQLAQQLNDRGQLAITLYNLGILYQNHAEALVKTDPARHPWLDKAVTSIQESLEFWLSTDNQVNAAASYSQLGRILQLSGELDTAEENTLKSLQIREQLDHPDLWKSFGILADIAHARGDEKAAAEWQAKADAKRAEIKRRERGEGTAAPRIDDQFLKALTRLAQVCYAVRAQKSAVPPDVAEALAQLQDAQAPFNEIGAFLHAATSGQALLPVPSGLPKQIQLLLEGLKEAIEEAEKD